MKFTLLAPWLAACLLAVGGDVAHAAQEVSVGRVDLLLPNEGWQVYALKEGGREIVGSGVIYNQTTESKLLVLPGADRVVSALLIVQANSSGKGRFSGVQFSDARCGGGPGIYAQGDLPGPAARSFRCLRVWASHNVSGPNGLQEAVKAILAKEDWKLPATMHAVSTTQHANTGAFATVVAVVRPEALRALPEQALEEVPALLQGVSPAAVQWARQLQESVSDSVYSIRGKLPVPVLTGLGLAERANPQ